MRFVSFARYFPELAFDECRFLFFVPKNKTPVREEDAWDAADLVIGLNEWYCDELDCDCRCVLFMATDAHTEKLLATIRYSFHPDERFPGPLLVPNSPQSDRADNILYLARQQIETDPDYAERLERHYAMLRQAVRQEKQEETQHLRSHKKHLRLQKKRQRKAKRKNRR